MNRREALTALITLPTIASLPQKTIDPRPVLTGVTCLHPRRLRSPLKSPLNTIIPSYYLTAWNCFETQQADGLVKKQYTETWIHETRTRSKLVVTATRYYRDGVRVG